MSISCLWRYHNQLLWMMSSSLKMKASLASCFIYHPVDKERYDKYIEELKTGIDTIMHIESGHLLPFTNRSGLQQRIDFLLQLGCTADHILAKVEILKVSQIEIMRRVSMLKDVGREDINVDILMVSKRLVPNANELHNRLDVFDRFNNALCYVLRCSHADLVNYKTKFPVLIGPRVMKYSHINQNGSILHSIGSTTEDIQKCPHILLSNPTNLEQRVNAMSLLRQEGNLQFSQYPLDVLAFSDLKFNHRIRRVLQGLVELDGTPPSLETIAQLLNVTKENLLLLSIKSYWLYPTRIMPKIRCLLNAGISKAEIISHIYIVLRHLKRIQQAIKTAQELSPDMFNIHLIIRLVNFGRLSSQQHVSKKRQAPFMSFILEKGVNRLSKCKEVCNYCHAVDRITVLNNFRFLTSQGFTTEDIKSCPVLLAHDPEMVKRMFATLWERSELIALDQRVMQNLTKSQVLSLAQYMFEKDMNFSSPVFEAEVQYGKVGDSESVEPDCIEAVELKERDVLKM